MTSSFLVVLVQNRSRSSLKILAVVVTVQIWSNKSYMMSEQLEPPDSVKSNSTNTHSIITMKSNYSIFFFFFNWKYNCNAVDVSVLLPSPATGKITIGSYGFQFWVIV